MLISGPSGVGKTLLAQKVTDRLERQRGVTTIFVDSLGKTTGAVLRAVLERHPNGPDDVVRTTPTESVCREFRRAVDGGTVVVLDEGDDLPETEAINELLATAHVTVIAIAHEGTDWLSRLDVVASHPFGSCHIEVGRYGVTELADILERRAIQASTVMSSPANTSRQSPTRSRVSLAMGSRRCGQLPRLPVTRASTRSIASRSRPRTNTRSIASGS